MQKETFDDANGDINEVFFDIALSENRFVERGYEEGFLVGQEQGWRKGFEFGVIKGAQIGSKVAMYKGFSSAARFLITKDGNASKRIVKALDALDQLTETIPSNLTPDINVGAILDKTESKFKQICSLMNVNPENADTPKLDF